MPSMGGRRQAFKDSPDRSSFALGVAPVTGDKDILSDCHHQVPQTPPDSVFAQNGSQNLSVNPVTDHTYYSAAQMMD